MSEARQFLYIATAIFLLCLGFGSCQLVENYCDNNKPKEESK